MRIVRPGSEDEMVALFLRAGLGSPRERERLAEALDACSPSIDDVRSSEMTNEALNRVRREVLVRWYGLGKRKSVFGGMPSDVNWNWAELDEADFIERVFTIKWFFEEEYGTRSLAELAQKRRRASIPSPILDAVRSGRMPEPPILLGTPNLERLVILEGHNRLLNYLADPADVPFPLTVLIGVSTHIDEWSEW